MSVFKTIMGITLLTTSLGGEAAGKIGRYNSTATEYVSSCGKEFTGYIGDCSHSASKRISNLGQNDFIKVSSSLTQSFGDFAHGTSGLLESAETTAKNVAGLFGSLETNSQWLRGYATNLIRDEEYQGLNAKFNFKSEQETSKLEGEEDWDSIKPIINYRDDRATKKITFNQSTTRKLISRAKDCLPKINPL